MVRLTNNTIPHFNRIKIINPENASFNEISTKSMPYIISVSGGKGGIGKTSLANYIARYVAEELSCFDNTKNSGADFPSKNVAIADFGYNPNGRGRSLSSHGMSKNKTRSVTHEFIERLTKTNSEKDLHKIAYSELPYIQQVGEVLNLKEVKEFEEELRGNKHNKIGNFIYPSKEGVRNLYFSLLPKRVSNWSFGLKPTEYELAHVSSYMILRNVLGDAGFSCLVVDASPVSLNNLVFADAHLGISVAGDDPESVYDAKEHLDEVVETSKLVFENVVNEINEKSQKHIEKTKNKTSEDFKTLLDNLTRGKKLSRQLKQVMLYDINSKSPHEIYLRVKDDSGLKPKGKIQIESWLDKHPYKENLDFKAEYVPQKLNLVFNKVTSSGTIDEYLKSDFVKSINVTDKIIIPYDKAFKQASDTGTLTAENVHALQKSPFHFFKQQRALDKMVTNIIIEIVEGKYNGKK